MVSNKLDVVFDVTSRIFQWDNDLIGINGRVVEILSEHTLQGFLQGSSRSISVIRGLPWHRDHDDHPILQVCEDGNGDQLATASGLPQLHRDFHPMAAGTQRLLASESIDHQ
ncbi:hypothetical protein BC936DRAFT_146466 [Jimgerdemannia flammicorona]|uniref:Uncharacterized protein n=1 Tax=Jimgerdemannia flammicorona TaxID=994334 RepID=A0A433D7J6_9FUNG|nr:hypothetical protein BC936DRAFT_146466 [Jimgerdemannia flammicorona]